MPDPKIVVATGACALGGVYRPDAFTHGAVDQVLPVDVWIPAARPARSRCCRGQSAAAPMRPAPPASDGPPTARAGGPSVLGTVI